jgi:hypothetical protein
MSKMKSLSEKYNVWSSKSVSQVSLITTDYNFEVLFY